MKNKPLFDVRKERLVAHHGVALRILYLSDFHFTARSGRMMGAICDEIEVLNPSLILLGGDYADSRRGLHWFAQFMKRLAGRQVAAVAGNHDYFFGIKKIKDAVEAFHGHWIEKAAVSIELNGTIVRIDGNRITEPYPDAGLKILCLHKPLPVAKVNGYHLVFAGHLHGGQVVLWQTPGGLFPGRWFYRQNFLVQPLTQGRYFVSKGLGDTLPFRYHCNYDMVLVDVVPESGAV